MTPRGLLVPVAAVSAAVLAFEVSLMRILLAASWHHFAFLVISIALLGFGASGTALTLLRRPLLERIGPALFALALATAVAMPVCAGLASRVPVEARIVPALLAGQTAHWLLHWALLAAPFLLGASAIGLAVMAARGSVASVYAANLAGSGAGALLAPAAMSVVPPQWLPAVCGIVALAGAWCVPGVRAGVRAGAPLAAAASVAAWLALDPPAVRVDPFKYRAHVERLESQGEARRIAATWGPRGTVEVFTSDAFHDVPFLTGDVAPPPMHALVVDGHHAGPILRVSRAEDAAVVDGTLMSFPFELAPPRPRVVLLGERSGLDVWLAARHEARAIAVVQADPRVFALVRDVDGGGVLDLPGVEAHAMDTRHFVERAAGPFDVVQLAALESSLAGSGGIAGLAEDHLVTVEGLAACLRLLSPDGLLAVCRGIQSPPRDNVKLLATLVAALRRLGVERPAERIAIVRDFLAVCTMVRGSPWQPREIERLRGRIDERGLTPVWFPGIEPHELNRPDELPGPEGSPADWYHHAATRLFSADPDDGADAFIDAWIFDVRPPTDDRPFFLDFSRLRSIAPLREAFGDLWLTRAETAFLFVLAAMAIAGACGLALTVAPLLVLAGIRRRRGKVAVAAYFLAIGLAYLLLEMTVLSRLTLLVGDPVEAAAVTIAAFLVFSGAGSALARRLGAGSSGVAIELVLVIAVFAVVETLLLDDLAAAAGAVTYAGRIAIALAVTAPMAFPMGFLMPIALARLDGAAPQLVPWAWGVNGFASVIAAPLATALAMTWGYSAAGGSAALLYLAAGALFAALPSAAPLRPPE